MEEETAETNLIQPISVDDNHDNDDNIIVINDNNKPSTNVPPTIMLVGQPKFLSTESYSLILLVLSAFLYSFMGCFVKLAAQSGIPSAELVFLRALFQGVFVVIGMFYNNDNGNGDTGVALIRRPFGSTRYIQALLIARGAVGGLGFLFYFYTISVLPLGDAVTLLSLNPVITVLAASIFLQDAIYRSHLFAVAACVTGSVLLAHPSFLFGQEEEEEAEQGNNNNNINNETIHSNSLASGYLTAFLGACTGAGVYILIRRAGKDGVHTLQLLFSWCTFGILYSFTVGMILPTIMVGVCAEQSFVMPTSVIVWLYILGLCVFGSLAHFFLNYAARHVPAGISSIIGSTGIMWSYMFEVFIFHQIPQVLTLVGVALILLSLFVIALEKNQENNTITTAITMTTTTTTNNNDNNTVIAVTTNCNNDDDVVAAVTVDQMELQSFMYGSTDDEYESESECNDGTVALLKHSTTG